MMIDINSQAMNEPSTNPIKPLMANCAYLGDRYVRTLHIKKARSKNRLTTGASYKRLKGVKAGYKNGQRAMMYIGVTSQIRYDEKIPTSTLIIR